MHYGLGIDAGGTYTDAVILRGSDGKIVDSHKSFTTYPELEHGIKNVLDHLDPEYLKQVNLVSVSTTLSTNSLLEGTGTPVGLVVVGEHPHEEPYPTENMIEIEGGHDPRGTEEYELDLSRLTHFARSTMDNVSAYAVSAIFSTRNPEHELRVKEFLKRETGLPVVCGHELTQALGAYERSVTAVLNAQLIPITYKFVNSVAMDLQKRGIHARILMLKGDGSVYNIEDALEKPVETIFSGPAASLLGASYLAKEDTCAVIDVGGTSTDVAMLKEGLPEISESGSVVGGWKTRVRAMKMETFANGGDSHIWVKDKKVNIGPRRVIPLCVAAEKYPDFIRSLKRNRILSRQMMDRHYQPTTFFVRTDYPARGLSEQEAELLTYINYEPVSINDLSDTSNVPPSNKMLDSLIQKRLVQAIGFTPTDALHVLKVYNQWNSHASDIGAFYLSKFSQMGKFEFCSLVRRMLAQNMGYGLMSFVYPHHPKEVIMDGVSGEYPAGYRMGVPTVLLGGPVKSYTEDFTSIIGGEVIVPEHAEVGNAIGALVGKGVKKVEMLIRAQSPDELDRNFYVFSPLGRHGVITYSEAIECAIEVGRDIVLDYVERCGVSRRETEINVTTRTASPPDWTHAPLQTTITVMGVGNPLMVLKE
ncbi:hydantoinase/oxoprolinase family protein [Methanolobus sp. WCC1]|jgi:N-methylhydantoinase A/oxoprolinase/acetone carboxylase beta subunit|uniref:N-methylhydantoinase A/acetone carboxylase, beta subunit n=1 Tax=Methanolobus tindarius DSM 2278 TaxID=1090322 RepID=W9DTH4_METTI|nr:hydantoinase/oxoprolinase family protein [Methanolobus tindarius]ETA68940.1 N-methylhydantoinase A/acetone carboxylase, beta subunit [Methanolobus tindarius DSM 2278]